MKKARSIKQNVANVNPAQEAVERWMHFINAVQVFIENNPELMADLNAITRASVMSRDIPRRAKIFARVVNETGLMADLKAALDWLLIVLDDEDETKKEQTASGLGASDSRLFRH